MAHPPSNEHHEHDQEHGHGEPGGLNVSTIAVVGAVGIMLVVVIVLAVEAWLAGYREAQVGALRHDQPNAEMQRYRQEQRQKLNEPRWLDKENGLAAVPIERAMEIYAEQRIESGSE
jgi:ABC-type lipoprotein release transport system permease subunit